jgi:Gamma-glutamyl cyclotransferase, AIG2-like
MTLDYGPSRQPLRDDRPADIGTREFAGHQNVRVLPWNQKRWVPPKLLPFVKAPPDYTGHRPKSAFGYSSTTEWPVYYFLYGDLAKPHVLSDVLGLYPDESPKMRPAHIVGYELATWDGRPTLVSGRSGHVVEGMAYEIQSEEDEERLLCGETRAYKTSSCWMYLSDSSPHEGVYAKTFRYAGDEEALREGRFDRKLWWRTMNLGYWPYTETWPRTRAGRLPRTESGYWSVDGNADRELTRLSAEQEASDAAVMAELHARMLASSDLETGVDAEYENEDLDLDDRHEVCKIFKPQTPTHTADSNVEAESGDGPSNAVSLKVPTGYRPKITKRDPISRARRWPGKLFSRIYTRPSAA